MRFHSSASRSSPSCSRRAFGNQPYVRKSTLISPVWPSVTSTPSASRASRCRCAPSVPGPRELIVPEDAITLCQGTGGSTLGLSHLRAKEVPRDELSHGSDGTIIGDVHLAQRDGSTSAFRRASRCGLSRFVTEFEIAVVRGVRYEMRYHRWSLFPQEFDARRCTPV